MISGSSMNAYTHAWLKRTPTAPSGSLPWWTV
jgi:hypothetical protein